MTKAPERIWIEASDIHKAGIPPFPSWNDDEPMEDMRQTLEYIRADLVDPAAQALAEHTAQAIREAALREAAEKVFADQWPNYGDAKRVSDAILALIDKEKQDAR